MKINSALIQLANIAEKLDDDKLQRIGEDAVRQFDADIDSRSEWEEKVDQWVRLATQITEPKNTPWPNASNVKYPLVAISSMQFAARAYPALVPADGKLVSIKTIGADPAGEKRSRADRVEKHMSWQLMYQMTEWEEDMDKLLLNLAIVGTCFKKTYYDPNKGRNCSSLVLAKDLVVNYWARDLESARKTHILYMTSNDLEERKRAGLFLDIDLERPTVTQIGQLHGKDYTPYVGSEQTDDNDDYTIPYTVLEQHTWLDLDDDGYKEPYVVTVEYNSKKVLRIVARFDEAGLQLNGSKVVKIIPIEYFTKFTFIPNPDGGFYDVGFGMLLGSLNDSLNTLVNQLVDSGTLNNLQAGYISRGLTLKAGNHMFKPGEWKVVNTASDDLRKGIFPLPTKEPSDVLFKLFDRLEMSGRQLASVAEIMTGKLPGQNTPATTTMASVQEGMRLFTAVYKRVYRSLGKEYKKLFELNSKYLEDEEIVTVLDDQVSLQIGKADYETATFDVYPVGDPTAVTQEQKLIKAQALMELIPSGLVNPMEAIKRILEAQEQPNFEALINQNGPPPDPKQQELQMKMQMEQQKTEMKAQYDQMKMQLEQQKAELDMQKQQMELYLQQVKTQMEIQGMQAKAQAEAVTTSMNMQTQQQVHEQKLQQNDDTHRQKLEQQKQQQAVKPKTEAKNAK